MKYLFTALVIFLMTSAAVAQESVAIDNRLYDVFEATHLKSLQEKSPFHLAYYNYYLDHGYKIVELAAGKTSTYPEIKIKKLDNLNILKLQNDLGLKRAYDQPTFYTIKGENKLLVLSAEKDFIKELNQYLGREN